MWGEIEPAVKIQPRRSETEDKSENKSEDESEDEPEVAGKSAADTQKEAPQVGSLLRSAPAPPSASLTCLQVESSCVVDDMIEAVARCGGPVKSQQVGEAELSLQERREELLRQYRSRPLVFMERYQLYLKAHHLPAFAHLSSDPRTQHYSRVIQRRATASTSRTRVRNQRYAALRALQREGQYFSEEQMRMREPLLYEQYIGQYLTDEEVLERSQEAMQDGAQWGPAAGTGGLAHLLLDSYQERLIQNRLQEEQEREEGAQEEEEDEDDGEDSVQQHRTEPSPEEKALLREEFISQMHQRFLDGKDKDFNYSEVDGNPDYDNLDIVSRDAEDKYFDEDDEEEEDEVENEEEEDTMTE